MRPIVSCERVELAQLLWVLDALLKRLGYRIWSSQRNSVYLRAKRHSSEAWQVSFFPLRCTKLSREWTRLDKLDLKLWLLSPRYAKIWRHMYY